MAWYVKKFYPANVILQSRCKSFFKSLEKFFFLWVSIWRTLETESSKTKCKQIGLEQHIMACIAKYPESVTHFVNEKKFSLIDLIQQIPRCFTVVGIVSIVITTKLSLCSSYVMLVCMTINNISIVRNGPKTKYHLILFFPWIEIGEWNWSPCWLLLEQQGSCPTWTKPEHMTMSWHENLFHITCPLWGESTGHQWIPLTKGQ